MKTERGAFILKVFRFYLFCRRKNTPDSERFPVNLILLKLFFTKFAWKLYK